MPWTCISRTGAFGWQPLTFVPNMLTAPAMLLGLALNVWAFGWDGLQASLVGWATAIGLLVMPFAAGGIGGGDVKMMGAVGALLGPRLLLLSLFLGLVLGGVFAVGHLLRLGRLQEKLGILGRMVGNAAMAMSLKPLEVSSHAPGAVVMPYSVPLGIGTACVLVSRLVY